MIRRGNLNLVVVLRQELDDRWLQEEVNMLEGMLRQVMHPRQVARCTEVADLKRYRMHRRPEKVMELLQNKDYHKPFVFMINLN